MCGFQSRWYQNEMPARSIIVDCFGKVESLEGARILVGAELYLIDRDHYVLNKSDYGTQDWAMKILNRIEPKENHETD